MPRRFRRKGRTGVWMPVYGQSAAGNTTDLVQGTASLVPVSNTGDINYEAVPCTFDYTESAYQNQVGLQAQTLHDIVSGQEWRLRRIVGKCFVGAYSRTNESGNIDDATPPAVEVACGYIVLRTDEEGDPVTDLGETNPLVQESAEDPWVWRRKWLLGVAGRNYATPLGGTIMADTYRLSADLPVTNVECGSVLDGPHLDQKTARVIHRQERLFFMLATRVANFGQAVSYSNNTPVYTWYNIEHRLFGSLQFNRGNRRNASR